MPMLVVVEGPNRGATIPLLPGENCLGRDQKLRISLPDRSISRRHAVLVVDPEAGATLTDLGSTNATYLNGVRVSSAISVQHGDQIRLGDTALLFLHTDARREPEPVMEAALPGEFEDTEKLPAPAVSRLSLERSPCLVVDERKVKYLIGASPALARVSDLVARCAPLDTTMLIVGETGTGKELVAEALHRLSPRRDAPFVVVNCATLEPALLESDLFGHERGAFTGALARKLGKLELVQGGTLFLDEVGELPPEAQAKLLRAIDKREFQRVGGHETLRTSARFVAATHRDLPALIKQGRFREDLYFRLRVVEIQIPPLRERIEDVAPLVVHFLSELRKNIPARAHDLTPAAYRLLESYSFPGNVRELKNIIERCLIFCERDQIDVGDLPREVRNGHADQPPSRREDEASRAAAAVADANTICTLEEVEKTYIHRALIVANWNKSQAARMLNIDRNTLHAKIKRHGLSP